MKHVTLRSKFRHVKVWLIKQTNAALLSKQNKSCSCNQIYFSSAEETIFKSSLKYNIHLEGLPSHVDLQRFKVGCWQTKTPLTII